MKREIILGAIEGFEARKRRLDVQIAELQATLHGIDGDAVPQPAEPPVAKKRFSAAARRRMAAAQRARWEAHNAANQAVKEGSPEKPRRKFSAAARRNIAAAAQKRWARKGKARPANA
jgi:hypothetical protein